ncbi:unnamed protein product [Meganyctiphanes norvegica]|uniref:C-type lectin domain-containing protein n=1 Tax=Meganyctiphanes norvegica TaxID=48144 RepID=A0AAV2QCM6_MEGNR
MDWAWMSIALLLLTSALPQDSAAAAAAAAAACDDDCKVVLTQEFRSILKQELQPLNLMLNELKPIYEFLNEKFKPLDDIQQEVGTIRRDTRDVFVMSEELLQHTQTVITKQDSMSSDLHSVNTDVQRIVRDTDTLDTKALFLAQNINAVKKSVPELNHKISLLALNITDVKRDTDILKESNEGINTAVVSLEDSVVSVNITSSNTSRMIMQIQQELKGLEVLVTPINEIKQSIQNIDPDIKELNASITDLKSLEMNSNQILQEKVLEVCKSSLNATILGDDVIMEQMEKHVKEINNKRTDSEHIMLNTLLMAGQDLGECPEGFFVSTQCFKVLMEEKTNWSDARERCHSEGLVLAEPADTIAVPLTRFLLQRYGHGSFWINAHIETGKFLWQRSNKTLDSNTRLRTTGQPGDLDSPGDCLSLLVSEDDLEYYPGLPYNPHDCSDNQHYPLCERILQDTQQSLKDPLLVLEENISINIAKMENNVSLILNTIEKRISTLHEAVESHPNTESLKARLRELAGNISTDLTKVSTKLSTRLDDTAKTISTLEVRIESHPNTESLNSRLQELSGNISTDLTKVSTKLSTRLDETAKTISTLKVRIGCLLGIEGFFSLSTQCFKFFTNKKLNWADAKTHCESHGLILVEPADAVALDLRKYVVDNYGDNNVWIGGCADGSKWVWQDTGITLENDNSLWHSYRSPASHTATTWCLLLLSHSINLRAQPGTPYYTDECSITMYPLCEAK